MDAGFRLSFDPGKTGVLTNLPVAVAAETVGITRPPIYSGQTVPFRAQARQHGLNLRQELCSVFLRSAGGKGVSDQPAGVINQDARRSGLGTRNVPSRLITAIRIGLSVATKRNPWAGVELEV